MNTTVTILGSGTSTGIPLPGCHCKVCSSNDPKNKRLRTALFLKTKNGKNFLIDTGPDLRQQLLTHKIEQVDSIIITHSHADHIHGLDDTRGLCFFPNHHSVDLYAEKKCAEELKRIFAYVFDKNDQKKALGGEIPLLKLQHLEIMPEQILPFTINETLFQFFLLPHGCTHSLGFFYDDFAYFPDSHTIPKFLLDFTRKKNLKLVIMDCTQRDAHKTHITLPHLYELALKIKAERIGLIHLNHQFDHAELETQLSHDFLNPSLFVTYDGQILGL